MQEQRLITAGKICQLGYDLVNDFFQRRVAENGTIASFYLFLMKLT